MHDVGTYTCVGADVGRFKQLPSVARRARLPSSCCFISFSEINLTLINVIPLVPNCLSINAREIYLKEDLIYLIKNIVKQ